MSISAIIIFLATFLMASCSFGKKPSDPSHTPGTSTGATPTPTSKDPPEDNNGENPKEDPTIPSDQMIQNLMDSMTLEEKLARCFFGLQMEPGWESVLKWTMS